MPETEKRRSWLPFAIALILSLIAIVSQPMGRMDRVWSDIVLTSEKSPVPQKYLIVDITGQDMRQFDGPPLPRDVLARALTRLQSAGAKRVLIDTTLSEELSSPQDLSLVKAMAGFGPGRLAIPQNSAPKFMSHATGVDLRLLTDPDGWTRAVRSSPVKSGYNPAIWLASGQLSNDVVSIDLRFDPKTVKRMSLGGVLGSHNLDISGYDVIISPGSLLAPSRVQLPLGIGPDRPTVIMLGAESFSKGYQKTVQISWWASVGAAFMFLLTGVLLATSVQSARRLFFAAMILSCVAVGLNMGMMKLWGAAGYPLMQFTCSLIGVFTVIGFRLRLFQMFSSFLKGDLSPEEAWAWRAYEDSQFPVILINAMGHVRRMNPVAVDIKAGLGESFDQTCQAQFRQGAKEISILDGSGLIRKFSLEWPSAAVAIIVMKDITEAVRKFEELEANTLHLQQTTDSLRKSHTQAVELAETFEQKKDHAEAVSQKKSNFLANMSHELRTPLNSINGFSDIMVREVFGPLGDPRYKEFANNILFSGQHLLSLINDILDLSKIEAGKMKLNIDEVDIGNTISQCLNIVNVKAQEAHLRLIYEEMQYPKIKADPRAIKQILLNLLTNAIKFTPEGGVVKVEAQVYADGTVIRVSDSGIGISPENIERLAQPFAQVDNEETKKAEGTGLGLSLSKSLTEMHGGTFKIESEVGRGTMISLIIPHLIMESETADAIAPAAENRHAEAAAEQPKLYYVNTGENERKAG